MKLSPQAQALLNQANANTEKRIKEIKGNEENKENNTKTPLPPKSQSVREPVLDKVSTDPEYPFTMKIRGRDVHYRSWKVKDMRNYKTAENLPDQRKALVYDCLKEDIALDTFEYLFALIQIRLKSISDKINYQFKCSKCDKPYIAEVDLSEVVETSYTEYEPFTIGEHTYVFSDIKNRDFYESLDHSELLDLIMHIESIDNDNSFTLEEVSTFIDDLPVKEFLELKDKFNDQRFKVEMKGKVKCTHCGNEVSMIFDTLPNFVPEEFEY